LRKTICILVWFEKILQCDIKIKVGFVSLRVFCVSIVC